MCDYLNAMNIYLQFMCGKKSNQLIVKWTRDLPNQYGGEAIWIALVWYGTPEFKVK